MDELKCVVSHSISMRNGMEIDEQRMKAIRVIDGNHRVYPFIQVHIRMVAIFKQFERSGLTPIQKCTLQVHE